MLPEGRDKGTPLRVPLPVANTVTAQQVSHKYVMGIPAEVQSPVIVGKFRIY